MSGDKASGCIYTCKAEYKQSSAPTCDVPQVCVPLLHLGCKPDNTPPSECIILMVGLPSQFIFAQKPLPCVPGSAHESTSEDCDEASGNQESVSGDKANGCTYTCKAEYKQSSAPACDEPEVCVPLLL